MPAAATTPTAPLAWTPARGDYGMLSSDRLSRVAGHLVTVSGRMPAGGNKMQHTWDRLERLGLGSLVLRPRAEWAAPPSDQAARFVRGLREAADVKAREATDPGTLATAMGHLERFAVASQGRPLFMDVRLGAEAYVYNAETFELLTQHISQRGSVRPGQHGRPLRVDTVSDYTSALKSAVACMVGSRITRPEFDVRRGRIQKRDRKRQPKTADRTIRRLGFRARYFDKVAASAFDSSSANGEFRWATWLATWACLMRPGEPGWGSGKKPWNPEVGICIGSVVFWSPALNPNRDGRWSVCLMIRPIKDKGDGALERRPTVISSRQLGGSGEPCDDHKCAYSHIFRLWRRRVSETCRQAVACTGPSYCCDCSVAPLFAWPGTLVPWSSEDGLEVVKDMASAVGLDPNDYGGASGRIAGASDIKDAMGPVRGAAVVHQRGRWDGDMEAIYARETAAEQMEASVLMGDASRPELEALLPGWVQPTRGWGRHPRR